MKYFKYIALVLIVVLIGYLSFLNFYEDEKSSTSFSRERNFDDIALDLVYEIEHTYNATDYVFSKDRIYLKDYSTQQIIQVDTNLIEINRFGKKGGGPKENLLIRAYDVGSGFYRTIDAEKNTVSKISFEDSLIYTYKPDLKIDNGAFINADSLIIKGSFGEFGNRKIQFTLLNKTIQTNIDLKFCLEDKRNSHWIYDGYFNQVENGGVIYVTYFSNKFVKFDSRGNIVYCKSFIYEVPEIVLNQESGMLFPIKNDIPNVYSSTTSRNFVYFLTGIGSKKFKNSIIIDVYHLSDGEYFNSVAIKKDDQQGHPSDIRYYKNHLYLFYDTKLKKYKVSF